jgi:uncharacterized DUF497 family protein
LLGIDRQNPHDEKQSVICGHGPSAMPALSGATLFVHPIFLEIRIFGVYVICMITFDQAKRDQTFKDRGLAFEDAALLFEGPVITIEDTRKDYGEQRYQSIGFLAGRMVMVVWTPRGADTHIISMRKCNDRERAAYEKRFGEG